MLFFARFDPATYQRAPIHVRQPAVRSRGEIGAYRFGRTPSCWSGPGATWSGFRPDEGAALFGDRPPLFTVALPDGSPAQLVYEVERR